MNNHRPGPWILSETSVVRHGDTKPTQIGEIFCNRNNKLIAEIPDYCCQPEDVEQDMADARLISAAPELLEALQMAMEIGDQCSRGFLNQFQAKARAAIAKATS